MRSGVLEGGYVGAPTVGILLTGVQCWGFCILGIMLSWGVMLGVL